MFLAKNVWKGKSGQKRYYYVLRHSSWDKLKKRPKPRYFAYVGKNPVLTLDKALAICQKLGCSLEELRRIRNLRIEDGGSVKEHDVSQDESNAAGL